jgi:hypothetical protein
MPSRKSAIQHSLYARRMTQDEIEAIGAVPILNIDGEIAYQRAVINRLARIIENNGLAADSTGALNADARSTIKLLQDAMARLLSYLRLHNALQSDLTELRAEIERGKMIGRRRRHVDDYFRPPAPEPASAPAPEPGEGEPAPRKKHVRTKKVDTSGDA